MTQEEVKQTIARVGQAIGADVPVLFGIAEIESNFNAKSVSKSGTYVGAFQLSNGGGGCEGDDRLDLAKAIKCVGRNHSTFKDRFLKARPNAKWDAFFHYGIHQMGMTGFLDIYDNYGKSLSSLSEARRKNILANKPSSASGDNVNDWWNYFYKKFYDGYNMAIDYGVNTNGGGTKILVVSGLVLATIGLSGKGINE